MKPVRSLFVMAALVAGCHPASVHPTVAPPSPNAPRVNLASPTVDMTMGELVGHGWTETASPAQSFRDYRWFVDPTIDATELVSAETRAALTAAWIANDHAAWVLEASVTSFGYDVWFDGQGQITRGRGRMTVRWTLRPIEGSTPEPVSIATSSEKTVEGPDGYRLALPAAFEIAFAEAAAAPAIRDRLARP